MMHKNIEKFSKLDLREYEGKCVGIVDGKILLKSKNPSDIMKKLLSMQGKEVSLVCVPRKKTAMVI